MAVQLSSPPTADILLAAFERHLAAIEGLADDKLLSRVNFDVGAATATILGAHPALMTFREELRRHLPLLEIHLIDELESIVHAALYIHAQARTAPSADDEVTTLFEQGKELREKLQPDATAAARRGLVDADALEKVPRGMSKLQIAQSLLGLSVLFRASWNDVKNKTAVTLAELDDAARIGVALLAAIGREDNPTASSETRPAEVLRLRALSFLVYVYNEARRGMSYLRWHEGDFADFTPSLVGPRGPRARVEEPAEDDKPAPEPVDGNSGGARPVA